MIFLKIWRKKRKFIDLVRFIGEKFSPLLDTFSTKNRPPPPTLTPQYREKNNDFSPTVKMTEERDGENSLEEIKHS